MTEVHGKPIPVQGQVYYMLTRELPANYLHWLESDDTQILIEGGPVDYYVFHPDGRAEMFTMGRDVAAVSRDTPKHTSWGRGQNIPPVAAG
jgi:predicted cupin superfamily sugar epimerase